MIPKFYFLFLIFLIKYTTSIDIDHLKVVFSEKDCIAGSLLSLKDDQTNNDINKPLAGTQTIELLDQEKSVLSQLQELAQYHSIGISYELIKEEGPSHSPTFTINLYLGDETYTATGNSLKEAKRKAAIHAIKNTKFEHPPIKIKESEKTLTPTVLLNNLASKLGLSVSYSVINNDLLEELQSTDTVIEPKQKKSYLQRLNDSIHSNHSIIRLKKDVPNLKGPFKVKVLVNGEKFIGTAHTVQNAKHEAASKALKHLKQKKDQDNLHCLKEGSEAACKEGKNKNKSPISLVYEAAQKRNLEVDYEIVEEKGPSHKKSFVMRCSVGEFNTTGQGSSKKVAKKIASENMLQKLQNLPIPNEKKLKKPQELSPKQSKNQKRRQRKKDKIIRTTLDKIDKYVENFVEFGANMISKFTGTQEPKQDLTDDKKKRQSPTDEILQIGNILNLNIQFSEVQNKNKVFTVVDLGTNPSYICLGEGVSKKNSRDLAARNGIKFLYQLGFLDDLMDQTSSMESNSFGKEENHNFWLEVVDEETE